MPWDGSEEDPGECLSGRTTLFGFVVDVDGLREMSIGLHSPFHAEWFYQAVQIGVTADFCWSLGGAISAGEVEGFGGVKEHNVQGQVLLSALLL